MCRGMGADPWAHVQTDQPTNPVQPRGLFPVKVSFLVVVCRTRTWKMGFARQRTCPFQWLMSSPTVFATTPHLSMSPRSSIASLLTRLTSILPNPPPLSPRRGAEASAALARLARARNRSAAPRTLCAIEIASIPSLRVRSTPKLSNPPVWFSKSQPW